jgi:DNA-binding SARP family transcriptional activator
MPLSLHLLGGASVQGPDGPARGPLSQRHRLALLAVLAGSHPRAVGRDKLMALLWPERDAGNARLLLNQAVHVVRRSAAGDSIVTARDELRLDPAGLHCDVVAFDEAIAAGDAERAVGYYGGPFLDGFFLNESVEFERWVDRQRDRLATSFATAAETLAEAAARAGDAHAEVRWWKARADQDPLHSRVACRVMEAMARAGNRAGAVQHGRAHQLLLARELDIEPDPSVSFLIERLRRGSHVTPPDSVGVDTYPTHRQRQPA